MKKFRMKVFRALIPVMLLMLFVLPREVAKADTAVCKIGNNTYSSLKDALTAVKGIGTGTITTGGEFHGKEAGIYWINAITNGSVTPDTYQSKIIPYGYQLVSMSKANTVATAVEDRGDILTENDVMVREIQSTLSFDSNGGEGVSASTITYNSTYGTLPVPLRASYTFVGWFTEAAGGVQIKADTKVTAVSNQTVYAHWTKNATNAQPVENGETVQPTNTHQPTTVRKITVFFIADGGMRLSKKSKVVTYGEKVGTLPTVVKSKYIFAGWYTKKKGGTKVTATKVNTFTKNTTLYAHWKKVTVKKQSIQSVGSKKGKVSLYIKPGEKVKGYQIALAKNKRFTTGVKKFFVTNTKSAIAALKKGETYHIRVRAYKYDSRKNKIFGSWSSVKKVNVK